MIIRKVLSNIWTEEVKKYYAKGLICSERQLQSIMYKYISDKNENYFVWVEPLLKIKDRKVIPDIVITDNNYVIAIVELKYVPHHYPEYKNDLEKLVFLSEQGNKKISLLTNPIDGKSNNEDSFNFGSDILFSYCAIGNFESDAVNIFEKHYIGGIEKFLHLYGKINSSVNLDEFEFGEYKY